jgi:hypothetical protein
MRRSIWVVGLIVVVFAAVGVAASRMLHTHDQDVTVYSVRPDGRVQAIGLRHRTYLLNYGGRSDLVLFGTTIGTGVLTHGPEDDPRPGELEATAGRHDP